MMSNSAEIRWRQRFANFTSAMASLVEACEKDEYSNLERSGLVQTFEFSFELAWNTLKDLLFYEGFEPKTPRETIRTAFVAGYFSEAEAATALDALEKRNILSHSYDETNAKQAVSLIKFHYLPMLRALHERLRVKQEAQ